MKGIKQALLWRASCVMLSCIILSSCMVGPDFKKIPPPAVSRYTALPMPSSTAQTTDYPNAGKSQHYALGQDISGDWWQIFHSAQINALVEQGLANSPNLAAAKAALREAKDNLFAQIGGLMLPSIDLGGTAQRAQTSALTVGVTDTNNLFDLYNASFQSSYLLDIWGASRRQIEAYAAQVDYQRYELMGAYLTLTSNIVTTAITIASLREQIKTTHELIDDQSKLLSISRQQLAAGGVDEQNVLTQQTQLAQTEASLPPLENSLSDEEHMLAALVGKTPSQLAPQNISLASLNLPKNLPVSLPSQLVNQRPDIQASEALLHAASAQVGIATANLLPRITLTANYGWLSDSTDNLFTLQNSVWSLAAGLMQPIFHGGQLIMQRRAAMAAFDQAAAQYKETVLQAFKNVADALRATQIDAVEFQKQTNARNSAYRAFKLISEQYKLGGQDYLAVLNAQQQYQQIAINQVKAQAARYNDTAALYQALGGGWWNNNISQYEPLEGREFYH